MKDQGQTPGTPSPQQGPPRLLARLRATVRVRHYSIRTPERRPGVGLAIPFPGRTAERRPAGRAGEAAPPGRVGHAAGREGSGEANRTDEAGDVPLVPARLRDPPAVRRLRHPDGAGTARPRGRGDDGLHARPEPRRQRGTKPGGRPAVSGGGSQPIPAGIGCEPCRPFRPAVRSRGTGTDGANKGSVEARPARSAVIGCEQCGGCRREVRSLIRS